VEDEDRRSPLSDQQIATLLAKEQVNVARRTVTKYRESLGILSASLRRQYD
jgi:RNA polymerase sigma-54 factor